MARRRIPFENVPEVPAAELETAPLEALALAAAGHTAIDSRLSAGAASRHGGEGQQLDGLTHGAVAVLKGD